MEIMRDSHVLEVHPEDDLEVNQIRLPRGLHLELSSDEVLVRPLKFLGKGMLSFLLCTPLYEKNERDKAFLSESHFKRVIEKAPHSEELYEYYKNSIFQDRIRLSEYKKLAELMDIELQRTSSPVIGMLELELGFKESICFKEGEKITVRSNLSPREWENFVKNFKRRIFGN
ncbi:MAG: hypothetical protein ACE5HW_07445 [Candidatus Methanofastidiosia archaeon]